MLLEGKVALVTGGSQGIGLGIARRFAQEGARAVIADINAKAGKMAERELQDQGYSVVFCEMDVTDLSSIRQALRLCIEEFGGLHILVNNAGINLSGRVVDLDPASWDAVLAVNLTGSFLCSQVFCRHMVEQNEGGSVIFIASQAGKRGGANAAAYSSSKFGVLGLMECLAIEMAPHGIRVNAICPGNVDTPMIHWLFEEVGRRRGTSAQEAQDYFLSINPLKRLATPAEIGDVCVFLASSMASYVIGESINVDGGELSG
jgi:sorbitol-6-phosphate 2-dehydrogenase